MTTVHQEEIVDQERLAELDQLATRLRDAVRPVEFRPAATPADREAIFRLRGRSVIERGWMNASELPGGMEFDHFDEGAILLGGWLGTELVAASRLILPGKSAGTPLLAEFGIEARPANAVVHLDRVCVARERSDHSSTLTIALISASWLTIRARGFRRFSGIDSAAVTRLYRRLGFQVTTIGEPRMYWAEQRSPILFDPLRTDHASLNPTIGEAERGPKPMCGPGK